MGWDEKPGAEAPSFIGLLFMDLKAPALSGFVLRAKLMFLGLDNLWEPMSQV
jgi:hypothetical protein